MDSSLRETGQKGLSYIAITSADYKNCQNAAVHVPLLGKVRPRLPKGAIGVGVAVAAWEYAELYAQGEAADDNARDAALQGLQAFSALNASRFVARRLAGWNVAQTWSKQTVSGACLLLVLAAYDIRTCIVKISPSDEPDEDSLAQRMEFQKTLATYFVERFPLAPALLFALMLRPAGVTVVRALVGWCMLRTSCAASARLLFGDKGYSRCRAVLTEVEGSIAGFLGIVSFPLVCAGTALAGVGIAVGRQTGKVASAGSRLGARMGSHVASMVLRREDARDRDP